MATFAFQPGVIERAKAFHRLSTDQELIALLKVSPSSMARAKAGQFVPSVAAGLVRSLGLGADAVLRVVDDEPLTQQQTGLALGEVVVKPAAEDEAVSS